VQVNLHKYPPSQTGDITNVIQRRSHKCVCGSFLGKPACEAELGHSRDGSHILSGKLKVKDLCVLKDS